MKNNIKFIVLFVFVFLSGMAHVQAQASPDQSGFINFFKKIYSLQAAKELAEPMPEAIRLGATTSIQLSPGFSTQGYAFEAEFNNQITFPYFDMPNPYSTDNYIITHTPLEKMSDTKFNNVVLNNSGTTNRATIDEISTQVAIFDGLGRPKQQMAIQASPLYNDIVTFNEYDDLGREKKRYLPFSLKTNGESLSDPILEQKNFYLNPVDRGIQIPEEQFTYAETVFDGSPLNRVMKQGAPGGDWKVVDNPVRQTGEHVVSYEYGTNTIDEICLLEVLANGTLQRSGETPNYSAGKLYVNSSIDENENETLEYKNIQGQVVAKASYDDANWVETYYVYDDFGLLRYVLPPLATQQLKALWTSGDQNGDAFTTDWLANYAYYYKYDEKHRMIEKKLPGVLPVKMYYDKHDRLVLTQDGNMRTSETSGTYIFTAYDVLNRPVITGKALISSAPNYLMEYVSNNTLFQAEGYSTAGYELGYSENTNLLIPEVEVLTETYYDNYNYKEETERPYVKDPLLLTDADALGTIGFVTGTKTRIGDAINGEAGEWAYESLYYDEYGRMVYSHKTVDFGKPTPEATESIIGIEKTTTKYSFSGLVLETKQEQTFNDVTTTVYSTMQYDHAGRLLTNTQRINNTTAIEIASMEYDELGQLMKKTLGGGLQDVDYQYNIRGWLTHMNNPDSPARDLFAMQLAYNTPIGEVISGTDAQYNGNISAMKWTSPKDELGNLNQGVYGFKYDGLNRLLSSVYGDKTFTVGANTWSNFDLNNHYALESINYDLNGNIENLKRRDKNITGYLDNLVYEYGGTNQLQQVTETGNLEHGFISNPYAQTATQFTYDANGNLIADKNKIITGITYNQLNLPIQVSLAGGANTINYLYDAAGTKYKKTTSDGNGTRYYFSNFEYDNTLALDFIHNGEGRMHLTFKSKYVVDPNDSLRMILINYNELTQFYYLKDHLGNTRVMFADENNDGTPEVLQVDSYYPFGMRHNQANTLSEGGKTTQYLYNGKELQEDFSLSWYDYGARFYDPALARFTTVDPLAEWDFKMSPYVYVRNNPISFIDPDGRWPKWWPFKKKEEPVAYSLEIAEVVVTATRTNSSSSKKKGYSQEGGWEWTGSMGEGSPYRAKYTESKGSIDRLLNLVGFDFLPYCAFTSKIYDAEDEIKESKSKQKSKQKSDKDSNPQNKTNNRGEEIDDKGQPKGQYKDWKMTNKNGEYRQFQDESGDSALFTSPYGDSTLMVPSHRNKDGEVTGRVNVSLDKKK